MASSPGFGLVSVTPVISLSAAWTVEPAWKRNGTASSSAASRAQPHRPGPFRNPAPKGVARLGDCLLAPSAASWSVFSFVRGVAGGGGPGVTRARAAPTGAVTGLACSWIHVFVGWRDAHACGRRQGPSGPDAGPVSQRCRKRWARPRSREHLGVFWMASEPTLPHWPGC